MKKSLFFIVSVIIILVFASMGFAVGHDVGHVGHIDIDAWDECEDLSSDDIDAIIASSDIGSGTSIDIRNVSPDIVSGDFTVGNLVSDAVTENNGTITKVYAVLSINVIHDVSDPITGDVVLNFTGTRVASAEYLWLKATSGKYVAFKIVDGIVTITNPNDFFSLTYAVATNVKESGGGGGGCSLGMLSPLVGLLFIPLAFLLKK